MKILFVLIILGGLGSLGYVYRDDARAFVSEKFPQLISPDEKPAPTDATTAVKGSAAPAVVTAAPPAPRPPLAAGSFLLTQRVTITTESGVQGFDRGSEVRLLFKEKNGLAHVRAGSQEFTVKPELLTNDPNKVENPAPVPAG